MLERPLRWIAIVLSLIVAAGFLLFALDDFSRASNETRARLHEYEVADPTPAGERQRESRNSRARELIDDANDVLLKPFASVGASSDSRWVQRGVPTLLALLVYGFLIGYLSRFARGRG